MARWVVRVERGGPWDWSRDMREQNGWDEHAAYMDALFDDGFVLLVGPLEGGRDVLWVVEADSEESIRARMAEDPWSPNGMLKPIRIERWDIVLDSPPQTRSRPALALGGPFRRLPDHPVDNGEACDSTGLYSPTPPKPRPLVSF